MTLSDTAQNLIQLAACIGNKVDLKTLSIIYQRSPQEKSLDLWELSREGKFISDWPFPTDGLELMLEEDFK